MPTANTQTHHLPRFGRDAERRQTTQGSRFAALTRSCFLMAGGVVPRGLLIDRGVWKKVRDWSIGATCRQFIPTLFAQTLTKCWTGVSER